MRAPFSALEWRARKDRTALNWYFETTNSTTYVNPASDACLVLINAIASEGSGRPGLRDDFSDGLVKNVAGQCNTIVVIHNAGIRLVDQWIGHPNVIGVIFAHLPGQDSGEALTRILHGNVSPSGMCQTLRVFGSLI
ncbi:glycoside hydrolase 3 [Fusarium oxysporum]|nr:glycoside hydrolase 3 [Fusarium oxysporum]KAJ4263751.1 glycoside hydrolase 3 [Fusarium oxysporum]